jgi:putative SOS response-associated peptidase YedK
MCGRYASSRRPEDLIEEFEVVSSQVATPLEPAYNVAPTDEVYVVLERPAKQDRPQQRQLRTLRWGLVPSWAKDISIGSRLINARMETVAEKPSFKRAFAKRRCLIPADGYYEWFPTSQTAKNGKPIKQPFYIHPRDDGTLAMAGLYEIWRDPASPDDDPAFRWTCTIITTTAEDSLGRIHDRMPLMVPVSAWDEWLDPETGASTDLLVPAAPGSLEAYPVSTLVSNVKNDGPELIRPIDAE